MMEGRNQRAGRRQRFCRQHLFAIKAESLCKPEPEFRMVLGAALLVDEVFEQYLPCFEVLAARMQCAQVARKRRDMPVVLDGVVAQTLRGERARGPSLIKGMLQQAHLGREQVERWYCFIEVRH